MTLTFLLAYLFYNDGIQTVIASSSVYGEKELGFETSVLIATILLVQFVAFFGALLFGRLAERHGSRSIILAGLVVWMVIVSVGLFLPEKQHRAVPRPGGRRSASSWAAPRRCRARSSAC